MPFKVHPHMLRHATGFVLANKGTDTRTLQAYLGHRSIQSTVRYTELAPGGFFGGTSRPKTALPDSLGHVAERLWRAGRCDVVLGREIVHPALRCGPHACLVERHAAPGHLKLARHFAVCLRVGCGRGRLCDLSGLRFPHQL